MLSSTRWRPSSGGTGDSQTAPQMLTATGERRIVGNGEVETHYPEQRVQEPFGLAQREMVDEAAGSERSRWRDPSSAAAHPAGRSGWPSRQRSLPRTPTPSHRRGERGPGCRPASSPRDISSCTWDGTFDFIPVVWLLRRVTRSAGQTASPPQGLHATTPCGTDTDDGDHFDSVIGQSTSHSEPTRAKYIWDSKRV